MPYDGEKPNFTNQSDMIDEKFVDTVSDFNIGKEIDEEAGEDLEYNCQESLENERIPKYIYSLDGTRIEPEIRDGVRYGAVNISVVRTDVDKLIDLSNESFVNPASLRNCYEIENISFPLPSSGLYMGNKDPRDAWRQIIYQVVKSETVFDFKLKDGYSRIIQNMEPNGEDFTEKEVCTSCKERTNIEIDVSDFSQLNVSCENCGKSIYPTDRIGTPSRVNPRNRNIDSMRALMNIIEQIISFSIYLNEDAGCCVLVDGPLASFEEGGWIARGIKKDTVEDGDTDPLILGVQKTGDFKIFADKISSEIEQGSLVELSPDYIENNIKSERSVEGVYGEETYYGKNFIYKNNSGYMFSFNIPRKLEDDELVYKTDDYPRIDKALTIMDELEMTMYGDSLIPVHKAHDSATISEALGEKILSQLGMSEIDRNELS